MDIRLNLLTMGLRVIIECVTHCAYRGCKAAVTSGLTKTDVCVTARVLKSLEPLTRRKPLEQHYDLVVMPDKSLINLHSGIMPVSGLGF